MLKSLIFRELSIPLVGYFFLPKYYLGIQL